jgi:hypothetical protein
MGELAKRDVLYDLHLDRGCASFPLVADLVLSIRALANLEVQAKLTQEEPGWLGIAVPAVLAETLARRLRAAGARGEMVEAAYRLPQLSQEAAQRLAAPVLPELAARFFPGYCFKPPVLRRDTPRWYLFISVSEALMDAGHVPGGVLAAIDKLDGHVWSDEAMAALANRRIERLQPVARR